MGASEVGGYVANNSKRCRGGGGDGAENEDGEGQEGVEEIVSDVEVGWGSLYLRDRKRRRMV